ncbi:endoglucanase [Diaporthe helianthi]|uniref:Endoglucanase n=1 Tax=Diaporthe helianthi TaxID=158607 RepID=A0A2P5HQI5_DIAHE|nr:endoglucanase [Diaporthe helianthi]
MAAVNRLHVVTVLLALLFAQLSIAGELVARHIELVSPQPFIFNEFGPTNPLKPDGSDYPCKSPQGQNLKVASSPTEMAIGQDQTISFNGTAVHGGGSCQFALAEGLAPTNDSAWKVIQSIEGGCPKSNIEGNLQDGQSPDEYTFSIPDDFAPGDYTFAWTWVNRIGGQPEFYMNCAPITATGGGASPRRIVKDRRQPHDRRQQPQPRYPDLFLANLGEASSGCDTAEALSQQVAIEYPSPGSNVLMPNGADGLFKQPCDGNPRNSGAASGNGGSATGGAAAGAAPSATGGAAAAATASGAASAQTGSGPSGSKP